jgi:hypothetical protein
MTTQPPEAPEPPEPPPPPGGASEAGVPAGPWASDYRTPPDVPPEPDPPPSLATAVKLMYVGAALSAVGIVTSLLQRDELRDQIEKNDSSLTQDEIDTAVTFGLVTSIVIGLVVIGLWIWMARTNERGLTWARTTATVLGALSIVSLLASLAMGQSTTLGTALSVVSVLLAAVILYLLYRPDSNEYYRVRSR